jgi:hypothetical protein
VGLYWGAQVVKLKAEGVAIITTPQRFSAALILAYWLGQFNPQFYLCPLPFLVGRISSDQFEPTKFVGSN